MKHSFLLDENILYFAVKGVNEHDEPDQTATRLLHLIATNCHNIVIDQELKRRYWRHLKALQAHPQPQLAPAKFMVQFLTNSAKCIVSYAIPPELPDRTSVPAEDVHILRAALLTRAVVITGDSMLRGAIEEHHSAELRVLSPLEGIELARDV